MNQETEVETLRRHVRLGEEHLAKQHDIIARLRALGADTTLAEQLLASLEESQVMHVAHLERVMRS